MAGENVAKGRITLDTSSFVQSRAVVVKASQDMSNAVKKVGEETKKTETQTTGALANIARGFDTAKKSADAFAKTDFGRISAGIRAAANNMATLSGAAAAFATGGVAAAQNWLRTTNMLRALTGSQERANAALAEMRALADRTNQPFLELVGSANTLLPAIGRANVNLAQTLSIAQRLAVLDPQQGTQGAGIAIRELLSGTVTSLAMRFEMSRTQLQELIASAQGDPQLIINGLDEMVNAMGLTEEAMIEMGEAGVGAFGVIKSEVTEAMATAFTPLLQDVVLPLVRGFSAMVRELRENNPALLQFGAGASLIVAGIAPALLAISAMIDTVGKLKAVMESPIFQRFGGNLGRIAGAGLAVGGGLALGGAAAQGLANAGVRTGDLGRVAQGEDPLKIFGERIAQAAVGAANTIGMVAGLLTAAIQGIVFIFQNGARLIGAVLDIMAQGLKLAFSYIMEGLGNVIRSIGDLLNNQDLRDRGTSVVQSAQQQRSEAQEQAARSLETLQQGIGLTGDQMEALAQTMVGVRETITNAAVGVYNAFQTAEQAAETGGETPAGPAPRQSPFTEEELQAWEQFQSDLQSIEAQAQEQRLAATRQYEAQRTQIIADYEERLADMAEDEAVRRQRAEADLARNIARIQTDLADTIADIDAEYSKKISDLREESFKEEIEAQQDHEKKLRDMQRDHDESIRNAAASLDAIAVAAEQRKFAREQEQEIEAFNEAQAERKAQLEERLQQEAEEHQARLEQARIAAAEQIADMQANFLLQEQLRAEDEARQLARMQREHQQQLAQLDASHAERMAEITSQTAQELAARRAQFNQELAELNGHAARMLGVQRTGLQAMEVAFQQWLQRQASALQAAAATINGAITTGGAAVGGNVGKGFTPNPAKVGGGGKGTPPKLLSGSMGVQGGLYELDPGEGVMRAEVMGMLGRMLGGNVTSGNLLGAVAAGVGGGGSGGGGPVMYNTFNISGADNPQAVADAVERRIFERINRLGGRRM